MKRFGLYAAVLTVALTGVPVFSSQAAVKTMIIGGNCLNGGTGFSNGCSNGSSNGCSNGFSIGQFGGNTCGNQNIDINKFLTNYFSNCPSGNWNSNIEEYFPNYWQNGNSPSQNWQGQNQTTQPVLPEQPEVPSTDNNANQTFVQQVINLVNEERAKAGLSPLQESAQVSRAASVRAQETIRSFSHTRPDGSSFSTVLQQNGISYQSAGENIAYGQRTPQEVMNAWMNSQGHRANILNANFTTIGVGYVQDSSGVGYWTQLFVR